jgi:hypothetical protein
MNKLSLRCLVALPLIGGLSILSASQAEAVTIGGAGVQANQFFFVNYDGNVNQAAVDGLSAQAKFVFLGFTNTASKTTATFDIELQNTSGGGITSRVSALGFNVDPNITGGSVTNTPGSSFTNPFTGVVLNSAFPNQFGNIDICFKGGQLNNCQGGTSAGVLTGQTGAFRASLDFLPGLTAFNLDNFGVRYQSIDGNGFYGASGTGTGTPQNVPEPLTFLATGLALGFGELLRRQSKKYQQKTQVC